jgi:hypothetical protein
VHDVSTIRPRLRRHGERGQMVPISALMAVVILGASALAVDMTLQTHNRRTLQNVVDSAALAGAQDLTNPSSPASVVQTARQLAVTDAIKVLHTQLGFPIPNANYATQWAQNSSCVPSGAVCYADGLTAGEYTFSIDVPPTTSQDYGQNGAANYNGDSRYIEITLRRTTRNAGFANVIGSSLSTTGAHAVAFHQVPKTPFGFALYANTVVSTGNEIETIVGNTYSYRNINPQANGQAGYCAATNSDGSDGNIVLGAPQYPNTPPPTNDPANGASVQYLLSPNGLDPDTAHNVDDCSQAHSGQLSQMGTDAKNRRCPLSVQGVSEQTTWHFDSNTNTCIADPAIQEPSLTGPTDSTKFSSAVCNPTVTGSGEYQPGAYYCSANNQVALTVDHTMAPGVYHIYHNPNLGTSEFDVEIRGTPVSPDISGGQPCPTSGYVEYLCGVTFVLDANATIGVKGNGTTAVITPYFNPAGTGNDDTYPVYSGMGVGGTSINVNDTNAKLVLSGTVYIPGGSMNVGQNAFVFIQGQAIVNQWNVQSGNHNNPDILWDASRVSSEKELIRLVE